MTPTPEQTRKCSNCMWWDQWPDPHFGDCRGGPPHPRHADGGHVFPTTNANIWCGSFRMKEPGQ